MKKTVVKISKIILALQNIRVTIKRNVPQSLAARQDQLLSASLDVQTAEFYLYRARRKLQGKE